MITSNQPKNVTERSALAILGETNRHFIHDFLNEQFNGIQQTSSYINVRLFVISHKCVIK